MEEQNRRKKFTKLTLIGSKSNIEMIVEGEPKAKPEYCEKCGGIINLY